MVLYFIVRSYGCLGCVHVWDPRQENEPVISLVPPEGIEKKPDCWAVSFGYIFFIFMFEFYNFGR